ncbi:MAG: nucleotidyltransferase domain-containing protein [Planctomycetaceae bacterium]|nr:nucleotidyltransferase domain-containing protein [Planctomycetaceae bacterium]
MTPTREEVLQVLRENKERFVEKYGITKLGLFGSFARNEATEESDVDVCVEMPPVFFDFEAVREELESSFQRPVSVVRLREELRELFKERLRKDTIYV